ncbi:hypothetical protein GCK32_010108 [Trichostrongylus colubriformis]|uniref:Uncharacterized protein n=1 Tax=Trichostrongylus colubriformis TaxID=6319 RepID=A0AAN8FCZ6_TRICO
MTRVTCAICSRRAAHTHMRGSSKSKVVNAILMGSLSAFGCASSSSARYSYQEISATSKKICHGHWIQAAQCMCTEMALMGKRYTTFTPVVGQTGAYVTLMDIPDHLVDLLNSTLENLGIEVKVNCNEVWHFLNNALRRYYGTPFWPSEEQLAADQNEEVEQNHEVSEEYSNDITMEEELEKKPKVSWDVVDYESDEESVSSVETKCSEYVPSDAASASGSDPLSSDSEYAFPSSSVKNMKDTDPSDLSRNYLVSGEALLELFKFCPDCGYELEKVQLTTVDTVAVVKYVCTKGRRHMKIEQWESQEKTVPHDNEQTYKGNVAASVAALTTGLPIIDLQRWGKELKFQLPSKSFFWKVAEWAQPVIEKVSLSQEVPVFEEIKFQYQGSQGLHLTVDGAYYDHAGLPLMGNLVLTDGRSRLVLHNEVFLRSQKGKYGSTVEIEGFRQALKRLSSSEFSVASLTTNGSPLIRALQREVEEFAGKIRHFSPGCHLQKWFECELEKAAKCNGCEEIGAWLKRIRKFLWRSIEYGINNGLEVVPIFNTCLMHVAGVHKWPEDKLTGPYTKCYHDPVSRPCHKSLMLDGKALERFESVVLTESFQRDLANVSPFGDDTIYDVRKALDRYYYRKKMRYPSLVFPICSTLAAMHVNSWRMAETKRRRNHIQKRKRGTRLSVNSPTKQTWRRSVFDEVLKERLLALERSQNDMSTSEFVRELVTADEFYESEIL